MYVPTSIKISILKANPNKEGLVPIILRFVQNRKPKNIFLRKYIPLEAWLNEGSKFVKERGENSVKNGKELNFLLNEFLIKGQRIILRAEREDTSLTFQQFKEQMVATKSQDFFEFCDKELVRRFDSGKFSAETIRNNKSKLRKLKGFRKTIFFNDLTPKFLNDYERYMRVEKENGVNTIFTAMKFLRTMINAARNQGMTDVYPFSNYKLTFKKNTRDRLYISEVELLQKLYDSGTLDKKLQNVLRFFLFVCYTGLSWKDLGDLDYSEIKDLKGIYVINKKRNKTDIEFTVPLLEEAKNMIDLRKKEGRVFPDLLTNQKANQYIKEVIKQTSIKKSISFHCGRHSFGTISLNRGIPREVVQRMMGHVKPEMTDLYSKVLDSYIITEMDKWKNGIETGEFKEKLSKKTLDSCKKIRTMLIANRIANGFTELSIAEKIGVTENDYKKMEMGEVQFGIGYLIEISRYLGINLKGLF